MATRQVAKHPDYTRQTAARLVGLLDHGRLPGGPSRDRLLGMASLLPMTFFFERDAWTVASWDEVKPTLGSWMDGVAYQCKAMVLTRARPDLLVYP